MSAAILASLAVGACSLGPALDSSAATDPEPEPEYRKLILGSVQAFLPGMPEPGSMEVSGLRRALGVQPGDWVACLRRTGKNETVVFAVFLKSHKIETVRRAVLVDKCEGETYAPLSKGPPGKTAHSK